jgi:integrase
MPRRAGYWWDKREQAYRTETGGKTRYFRGIARDDHAAIAAAFAAWMEALAAASRPLEPTADDVCLAFTGAIRGVKNRTVRTHKERLLVWLEWSPGDGGPILGARRASTLESRHLKLALAAWETQGLADHYRAGICRSVKAAFAWAASEEGGRLIRSNPFAEVRTPGVGRSPHRYAERREVAAFLRFAWRRAQRSPGVYKRFGRQLCLLARVAAHTGARPGELCSAWWEDFDPRRGTIALPPERHKTGGKTKRPRTIFLTPALVRALERERCRPDRHEVAIFVHKRGKWSGAVGSKEVGVPWGKFIELPGGKPGFEHDSTALARRIRDIRKEAVKEAKRLRAAGKPTRGLELIKGEGDNRFVLYQLRHTTASDHLMNKGDAATVAELLGTSVRMLETTYGHLLEDHLARAADELHGQRRSRGKR